MSPRPGVTVVMPFAGNSDERGAAIASLRALRTQDGDQVILADNSGTEPTAPAVPTAHAVPTAPAEPTARTKPDVRIIRAGAERSPAYARNTGAAHASTDWILFLDADCLAPATLLDMYFASPVADDVGALAGEVIAARDATTTAARYGAAKNFLGQQAHLAHAYRPRAAAANLMVRRAAFEQIGGFYEGVLAAEDTDFSWRLQQAGWRLELRRGAQVEHRYRTTIRGLRRQWRGYAAGRAWLARRYDGFEPEPALWRAIARAWGRLRRRRSPGSDRVGQRGEPISATRAERARHLALDALLGVEELRGLALSNRPPHARRSAPAAVVLVAERFPARDDPLAEFARTLEHARVEAVARPDSVAVELARELEIRYREDDGVAARGLALIKLAIRHPLRCIRDRFGRRHGEPRLSALAPAVLRLRREPDARLHALGGPDVRATARRLAALSGRPLQERERGR